MSAVENVSVAGADAGIRLDRWFKRHFPALTHGRLEKLLRTGQVRVDGARVKANQRLEAGQVIRVPPFADRVPGGEAAERPPAPKLTAADRSFVRSLIIAEDPDFFVFNKPHGLAVQGGTKTERHLDGLLAALGEGKDRPRLVHRLDRDTSGILLVAKSASAAAFLADAFRQRKAQKLYLAVTVGVPRPASGRISLALSKREGRDGRERVGVADDEDEEALRAETRYVVLDTAAQALALVAMVPVTGRTHQLRAHAAALETPILGDPKYGGPEAKIGGIAAKRLHLHAAALRFTDAQGKVRTFVAPLPAVLAQSIAALGFTVSLKGDPFKAFPMKKEKQT